MHGEKQSCLDTGGSARDVVGREEGPEHVLGAEAEINKESPVAVNQATRPHAYSVNVIGKCSQRAMSTNKGAADAQMNRQMRKTGHA